MERIGGLLLAVLGRASARFTDESPSVGNVASPGAERSQPLAWRRHLGSLSAAPARPPAVPMKIAVSDVRADVLVSLLIYDECSTHRCHQGDGGHHFWPRGEIRERPLL